jgi:hypothetical protein
MARGEMLRNVAQGEVETWTRTIRVDEKREHVETFFFYKYSLRDVERRPVLCSFKRIGGGSAYQKQKIS